MAATPDRSIEFLVGAVLSAVGIVAGVLVTLGGTALLGFVAVLVAVRTDAAGDLDGPLWTAGAWATHVVPALVGGLVAGLPARMLGRRWWVVAAGGVVGLGAGALVLAIGPLRTALQGPMAGFTADVATVLLPSTVAAIAGGVAAAVPRPRGGAA